MWALSGASWRSEPKGARQDQTAEAAGSRRLRQTIRRARASMSARRANCPRHAPWGTRSHRHADAPSTGSSCPVVAPGDLDDDLPRSFVVGAIVKVVITVSIQSEMPDRVPLEKCAPNNCSSSSERRRLEPQVFGPSDIPQPESFRRSETISFVRATSAFCFRSDTGALPYC